MNKIKNFFSKWDENKDAVAWIIEQSKGTKKYMIIFTLISFAAMLFSLLSPVASKYVVDAAIGYDKEFKLSYAFIMLGSTLISIALSVISGIFSSYVNEKFAFSIRAKMFDKTQRSNWKSISKFHSGDMLSRLVGDVDVIASNIISILPSLVITLIQLVIVLVIVCIYDPMLAVIGLIFGPVGAIASFLYRKPFSKYQSKLRESQSEYYTFFQETLSNISVVKSFQLEDRNNDYFEDIRNRRLKTVVKSAKISSLMSASAGVVFRIGYVVAFCWCAYQITSNPSYTYGTMTLFLSLVSIIQSSIQGLGGIVPKFYSMVICSKRIKEITEQEPEIVEDGLKIPSDVGLRFKNVSFTYDSDRILDNISFDIKPGCHVGIVGSSGVGKTTLIRLILALVKSDSGEVEYYGSDGFAEKVCPSSRRLISYVPQGNTLISGTVRDNLLAGNPNATDEMMWEALEYADAARFVEKNENGLDMPVQERSSGMSAGQAQRIGIARALLRDRPILIFDEATSALDEATERRIFERIIEKSGKTCLVITHRSSMLKYCDTAMEINDDGTIYFK